MSTASDPAPDYGGRSAVSVTGLPPETDQDHLEMYFDRFGDLKAVHLTEDGATAYIEYTDPPDSIPKVLSKTDHKIRKCPVSVEKVDLLQIMQPYLIIRGFPPFANKDFLAHHFQKAAGGVALQSVELKEGPEAEIFFADPAVTLRLASEKQVLMGKELEVTVGYSSPKPQEECVLAITGLSEVPLDAGTLEQALRFYFEQPSNGGHEILSCSVCNETAYIQFTDSSKVQEVVSQPPTEEFMAGIHLEMTAVPKSQVPGAKPETSPIDIPTVQQEVAKSPSQFASPQGPSPPQVPSQFTPPHGQGSSPSQIPGVCPPFSPASSWPSETWATQIQHSHSAVMQDPGTSFLGASLLKGQRPPSGTSRPPHQSMMVVDNLDTPFTNDQQLLASGIIPNKVIVKGFPPNTESYILKMYMYNLAQIDCTEFQVYGELAVATFQSPVGIDVLQQRSKRSPFPKNNQPLTIEPFKATTSIMVSNIPPSTPDFAVKMYFTMSVGEEAVSSVRLVPPSQALITFTNHQCVQKVMDCSQHFLGPHAISVREYYEFAESPSINQPANQISNTSSATSPTLPVTTATAISPRTYKWLSIKRKIGTREYSFLKQTQSELNSELESAGASASIEKGGEANYLNVSPLPAASSLPDWDDKVSGILHEHFSLFKEDKYTFPHEMRGDIFEYLMTIKEEGIIVHTEGDTVTISGKKTAVEKAMEKIVTICEEVKVVSSDFHLKRRQIKYILKFCQRDLWEFSSKVKYEADEKEEKIVITGTSKEIEAFKTLVNEKVSSSKEKKCILTPEAFQLLTSQDGQKKMEDALGTVISMVVYDFEVVPGSQGMPDHLLYFLALEKESCKRALGTIKSFTGRNVIRINNREFITCKTPEWEKFVGELTSKYFFSIKVTADLIVITGEAIAINGIAEKVRQFLEAETSVGDCVDFGISEWQVISLALRGDLDQIKMASKGRGVKITDPKRSTTGPARLLINGDPTVVSDVKQQLIMLGKKVEMREARVAQVPGLEKVLDSAEDKIKVLEQKHKAVIEIDVESGENEALKNQPPEELPRKLCTATLPNDIRVSIFSGNFTLQHGVGTIINFLLPNNHNFQQGSLKMLVDAGGTGFDGELQSRLSQCLSLNPPACISSKCGNLRCNKLLHCIVPAWNGGAQNEACLLEESLEQSLQSANLNASLLITAATASPFNYPAKIFAEKVVNVITGALLHQTTDIQVLIFINDPSELQSFEECLHNKGFSSTPSQLQVQNQPLPGLKSPRVVSSARSLSSGISSFITVTQGDMLKEQADIYINSTNESLNLSQGQLSQKLLKMCGQELQDECSQYAPLKPGGIAVTAAKNLPCKHIIHVVLPDHKTKNSERVFREAVKAILRAAADEGATSIAIPSLGVANLRYPPELSAKILFEEVIEFHTRTPAPIQKFHFVIFKKEDYLVFNKEYVQRMSDALPAAVQQQAVAAAPSISKHKHKGIQLLVVKGNIADESTDIIVNTTRENMDLSAGAVSKAILQKAGPKLQSMCTSMLDSGFKLDKGNIVVTSACGQLRCKKVLHAHIPPHDTAAQSSVDTDAFIEKVVMDCLEKAEAGGHKSVSFPVFGIGGGGYSINKAGKPMLQAFQKFSKSIPKSVRVIRILVIDDKNYDSFCSLFSSFFSLGPSSQSSFQSLLATLGLGRETCIGLTLSSAVSVRGPSHLASGLVRTVHNPIAVFRIFAASGQLDQIESEIRQCIKEKVAKETVADEHIASLLEDDIAEILTLQDELGISIRIIVRIKQIIIEGEIGNVSRAKACITDMMREIDQAEAELKVFDWHTCDEDNDLEPYPYEAAIRLERAKKKKRHQVAMVIDNIEVVIDLYKLEETSKVTGKKRKVIRDKKTQRVEYPPTWENQPMEGDKPKTCHLFDVSSSSSEFTKVTKEFEDKMGNLKFTVVNVQRVQNPSMYSCHVALRESMRKKHHLKAVEERKLFHGTRIDSVDAITHQGFNRNFAADANAAYFGKGAYFAVNAWYSAQDKYSVPEKSTGNQYMFVCNVLVGSYTKGSRDMKVAPDLPDRPRVPYDTLVDNVDSPTIFVAMTDYQAYPEYLIAFKVDKDKK